MKLLLIGAGPLPQEQRGMANAGGLRTEQFLQIALASPDQSGRLPEITLITIEADAFAGVRSGKATGTIAHHLVSRQDGGLFRHVRTLARSAQPAAVIGINSFPAFVAARAIDRVLPFWADLNGWAIAELQAQAFGMQSNAFLPQGLDRERITLKRADRVSVVSTPQKFAVYGELAMLGRLGKDNFATSLVEVVENSCRSLDDAEKTSRSSIYRGKLVPADALIACWLGGFNAWADEKTLFEALEKAMKKEHRLHFLATGGILPGIDETSFGRFAERIKGSRYQDRYHLLGWVTPAEVTALLRESTVGLNVDRLCLETETGARNRLNEMLRFGLPIVSTRGAEIATVIAESGAGLIAESGDSDGIAQAILEIVGDEAGASERKKAAQGLINHRFCETMTGRYLQAWLRSPLCANDHGKRALPTPLVKLQAAVMFYRQRGARAFFAKLRQTISGIFGLK